MPPTTPVPVPPDARGPLPLRTLLRTVATVTALACAVLVAACATVMLRQADSLRAHTEQAAGAAGLLHRDAFALIGVGAVVTGAVLAVGLTVCRTILRRAGESQATALAVAQHQIPELVRRLQQGEPAGPGSLPQPHGHRDEFGVINDALARLAQLASDSAQTVYLERDGFTRFSTATAARALAEAGTVLSGMDELQRRPGLDTASRQELARLDQTTVRLRRQLENLLLLTGGTIPDPHTEPVPVGNILLDAVGEVSQRERVQVDFGAQGLVNPEAAGALTHLLAELIENALAFSPPQLPVVVRSSATAGGIAFEIEDRGHGLAVPTLERLNRRLQVAPLFAELAEFQQLGLFVVGRLAAQLDLSARLRRSAFNGVSAVVHVPARLLSVDPGAPAPVPAPAAGLVPAPALSVITRTGTRTEPDPAAAVRDPLDPLDTFAPPAASAAARLPPGPGRTEDGLPLRVPGSHIAAPLLQRAPRHAAQPNGYGHDERSPEELADLFAHYPTTADEQEELPR
jgi:signal transduction histidine kinase